MNEKETPGDSWMIELVKQYIQEQKGIIEKHTILMSHLNIGCPKCKHKFEIHVIRTMLHNMADSLSLEGLEKACKKGKKDLKR